MTRQELDDWLRLTAASGIGVTTAHRLLKKFGLPGEILAQSNAALSELLNASQIQALLSDRQELTDLQTSTWHWLQTQPSADSERRILSLADNAYPPALLSLADAPLLLYSVSAPEKYSQLATKTIANDIAMVGSRRATPQGVLNAKSFAQSFAERGLFVVSGMALGIDGAAHEGALSVQERGDTNLGTTVAVVGTGLDRIYPARHKELAQRIARHGVLLSEFPVGTPPLKENFPRRNRLIAALTQGTLVVEAAIESGSLITARQALDLNKEVFAIPGSIHSPQSRGCHHLIKQGAKLVESAQDVLEELPHALPSNAIKIIANYIINTPADNEFDGISEKRDSFLDAMGYDPVSLDALSDRTGMDAASLQAKLLEYELGGDVARLPGGLFQRQARA
jgi:DNA processing protein